MAMKTHIFGNDNQWAISTDDGCLRFHPQYKDAPVKKLKRVAGLKKWWKNSDTILAP